MLTALIFASLLAGSIIKGAIGLGLPLVAIPVLSLFVGVPHALSVVAVPMVATNAWQIWQFRKERADVPFLRSFLILGTGGIAAGTWLLSNSSSESLEVTLACAVFAYLALRLTRPNFGLSREAGLRFAPAAGLGAGVLQGATGVSGPIGVTFFHSMGLARGTFMFCTAAMFLLFATLQLTLLTGAGIATGETFVQGLFALIPAALGLPIGNRLAKRLSAKVFDRLVLFLLVATAVPLFYKGVFG